MPTGMAAMMVTDPAATLPCFPGSRAMAGASAYSAPEGSTTSSVVENRTPSPVMHTVPAPMVRSPPTALDTPKRRTPSAQVATLRRIPRSWAWRSRYSPAAVWGKLWSSSHWAWR